MNPISITFKLEEALAAVMQSNETTEQDFSEEDDTSSDNESQEGSGEDFLQEAEEFCSSEREEEEEEEENAIETDPSPWKSKNGEILWFPTHRDTLPFFPPPILTPGPSYFTLARISSPETVFDLFFPDDILQLILHFTNLQGRRSVNGWRDVSEEELRAYLGLLILAGLFRSQHESTKSLWDNETGRAIFAATMSQKRFSQINLTMRFDDRLSQPETRWLRSQTCGADGAPASPSC